jgi:pantoate--beta-alanine ligase
MPVTVHTPADLAAHTAPWRKAGQKVALVPTMGALHQGHLALVQAARTPGARVVVSIFVNPLQFGPNEDYERYPRTLEADTALLNGHADAVYAPAPAAMYPPDFHVSIPAPPALASVLCGRSRPGHFDGVLTVVAKLFNQTQPQMAFFGEKDWQQLTLIRRMAADLNFPIHIQSIPTVREADGLALSSRNRYLSPLQRQQAASLPRIMAETAAGIRAAQATWQVACANGGAHLTRSGFSHIDYLEARHAHTLELLTPHAPLNEYRLFVAATLGATRLIDNIPL